MPMNMAPDSWMTAIVLEVQDTPDGRLAANITNYWDAAAPHASIDPMLQVLYTKRQCISLARGYWALGVDFTATGDTQVSLSQRVKLYDALYDQTQKEIERIELKARRRRSGASMALTTIAPISPPYPDNFDANDPSLKGSPYTPLRRRGFIP